MVFFIFLKIILLCTWIFILRGTLPRYRIDQLLVLSWKYLIFLLLFFFFFNVFLFFFYY